MDMDKITFARVTRLLGRPGPQGQQQLQQQHCNSQQLHHHQQINGFLDDSNRSILNAINHAKAPVIEDSTTLASSFDYNSSTIGSWSSPDTSSSNRSGWNADGSSKNDGVLDDGTAIWGNPTTKKTGVDWTEKESLLNPSQSHANNTSDKSNRYQKAEPIISSIDGTEAWGAPVRSSPPNQNHLLTSQSKNDISGNTYGNTTLSSTSSSSAAAVAASSSSIPTPNTNNHHAAAAYASAAAAAPSRDLLKQMVHQIQLAVQAGHLNAHILNQPMSAPTLQLVLQLLQQIKNLQQLQEIQQHSGNKSSEIGSPSNIDIQVNRVRQNIALLQKAITQQQTALTKTDSLGESNNLKQQQQQQQQHLQQQRQQQLQQAAANNFSYASISKLSTNMKVPPNNNMSNIIANSNLDSFRGSSLIDTLSNSNSDILRSTQAAFDATATIDETMSSLIQASSLSANNILGGRSKPITTPSDFSKAQQSFNGVSISQQHHHQQQQQQNKGLLSAQQQASSSTSSSNAWLAFNSGDFIAPAWPSRISSNASQERQQDPFTDASDLVPEFSKNWSAGSNSILSDVKDNAGSWIAPPPGLMNNYRPIVANSSTASSSNSLSSASVANGISALDNASKMESPKDDSPLQSREPSFSLWSGAWFD